MDFCSKCSRPKDEHSREALSSPNPQGWQWRYQACPIGDTPFHPTQTFWSAIETTSCNRHSDCMAADAAARAKGAQFGASHCHDECCEDCFGC